MIKAEARKKMDMNTYMNVPISVNALEYAVRLLSACPQLLTDVKNMQELFDKAVELEAMFEKHIRKEPVTSDNFTHPHPENFFGQDN
jgi:hypothetical protein